MSRPSPVSPALAETYAVWLPLQVRYRDLDALGHVNNAVYLSYLELARVHYIEQRIGPIRPQDYTFVIARIEIDFLRPLHLGDAPTVGLKPIRVGRSSFTFGYCLVETRQGQAIARAQSVQVYIAPQAQRSRPLPPRWRQVLTKDLARFGTGLPCPPEEP